MKKSIFCIVLVSVLSGCASPTVIEERQLGDQSLTCDQLVEATEEARKFEKDARGERGVTGTNVASTIFFWPGLIATYSNTEDAIDAAQERQRYLAKLYDKQGCDTSKKSDSVAKELERLRQMFSDGLISEEEFQAAKKKVLGI